MGSVRQDGDTRALKMDVMQVKFTDAKVRDEFDDGEYN